MNDLATYLLYDARERAMQDALINDATDRARAFALQKHANMFAAGVGHLAGGVGRAASALAHNPAALTAAGGAVIGAGMAGEGNRLGGALAGATVGGGLGFAAGGGHLGQSMQTLANNMTSGVQRFGTNMTNAGAGVVNAANTVVPAGGTAQTFGQMVSNPFRSAFGGGA